MRARRPESLMLLTNIEICQISQGTSAFRLRSDHTLSGVLSIANYRCAHAHATGPYAGNSRSEFLKLSHPDERKKPEGR